jgi:hypothetical protein
MADLDSLDIDMKSGGKGKGARRVELQRYVA